MATQQATVDYILDQLSGAGDISARKMFGEYALYCDRKVVALICDDQLFIKPTAASGAFEEKCQEAPPYPGAKNYLQLPEEEWSDRELLSTCIRETAAALPEPKKK